MVFVLLLAGELSWLLYSRFAEMPTRVAIENQFEPVLNLPFPAVTVCSPTQITASFMTHFNRTLVDGNQTIDLEKVLPYLMGFYYFVRGNITEELNQFQALLDLNRYTVPEIMAAIPQSCDNFLKLCFFDGVRYPNCSSLFRPLLTSHGFCCTFNNVYYYHDKRNRLDDHFVVKNVTRSGLQRGLIVVTDYNPDDALNRTILGAGATKVMYTDYTEFPTDDESCLVEPSVDALLGIYATYTYCSDDVKALPLWSRNCYLEDEHRLPHFRHYHNSDCDIVCYAMAVKQACGCTLFFMPGMWPIERTCNVTKIPCIMDVKVRLNEWMNTPQCDCLRDCESRRYKADLNTGNLKAMPHMIVNPFVGVKFNESTTIINFFFPSFFYVKQKQETVMSIITLASNVGGVFGLCMGCSGISVLEILFYIFVTIRNYFKEKMRRKRVGKIISQKSG